jgi:hypothetical protein
VDARGGSFYAKNAPLGGAPPYGGNTNWIWLQCCRYMEGKPLMSVRGCSEPGAVAGCVRITPGFLIGQVKEVLKHYRYAVLGTDAVLPTGFMGPEGEYNHSRGLPNSTFVSFCGDTGISLFLLALPREGGAYLLCQGWDERFGRKLGRPVRRSLSLAALKGALCTACQPVCHACIAWRQLTVCLFACHRSWPTLPRIRARASGAAILSTGLWHVGTTTRARWCGRKRWQARWPLDQHEEFSCGR